MPLRQKDRDRARRQRRQKKLSRLKTMYAEAKTLKEKQELEKKIRKYQPWWQPVED